MLNFVLPSFLDGSVCVPHNLPLLPNFSLGNLFLYASMYFGSLGPDYEGVSAIVTSMPGF